MILPLRITSIIYNRYSLDWATTVVGQALERFPELPDARLAAAYLLIAHVRETSMQQPDAPIVRALEDQLLLNLTAAVELDVTIGEACLLGSGKFVAAGRCNLARADPGQAERWLPQLDPGLLDFLNATCPAGKELDK